jgi:hypothetical protein
MHSWGCLKERTDEQAAEAQERRVHEQHSSAAAVQAREQATAQISNAAAADKAAAEQRRAAVAKQRAEVEEKKRVAAELKRVVAEQKRVADEQRRAASAQHHRHHAVKRQRVDAAARRHPTQVC